MERSGVDIRKEGDGSEDVRQGKDNSGYGISGGSCREKEKWFPIEKRGSYSKYKEQNERRHQYSSEQKVQRRQLAHMDLHM